VRTLRWLALAPACLTLLYLLFVATVVTHVLVERHLCPAAAFDRGICNQMAAAWFGYAGGGVSMAYRGPRRGLNDRVGNADCLHFCYWVEGGQVRCMPA
jgi:hypothetical protein